MNHQRTAIFCSMVLVVKALWVGAPTESPIRNLRCFALVDGLGIGARREPDLRAAGVSGRGSPGLSQSGAAGRCPTYGARRRDTRHHGAGDGCRVNPKLAKIDRAKLVPLADGRTELKVNFGGQSTVLPVIVSNLAVPGAVSFNLDVMPVFTRAGCNAGACHGTSRGKDGFHLSLYGFDPDGDYYFRLTREQIGRRVNLGIPEDSLIVQKGLGAVQHTGGVRFGTNSDLCQTLISWLAAGAPQDPTNVAKPTGIEIFPKTAVLEGSNSVQRFVVQARYSDGTARDVTPLAMFLGNNETVAKIGEDGTVTAGQRGEAFIQTRFAEFNVGAQVIVIPKGLPYHWTDVPAFNYVDEAIYAKLRKLRLLPSDICDDETFVRRAYIDITGTLPTTEELKEYDGDKAPGRRDRLVDRLLGREEFADLWVMKLAELLEIRSRDNQVYSNT